MTWNVAVEKVENGFICSYESEIDEGVIATEKFVFEESWDKDLGKEHQTTDNEKIAFAKMVLWLAEHFGMQYEKYGEENLSIKWNKKGHKL